MPSAARPFTPSVVQDLKAKGVNIAAITLHTGVSSLEIESETIEDAVLYPEPFEVTEIVAEQINQTRNSGGRIIAVGTTVVRALESAYQDDAIVVTKGFTKHYIHPQKTVKSIDGLITGLHDPKASHLAMLYTIATICGTSLVIAISFFQMVDIKAWVESLLGVWQVVDTSESIENGASTAAACFSEDVIYQETPFAKELTGREEIKHYWLDMLNSQQNVSYSYEIVSWHDAKLVLNWCVKYQDVDSKEIVKLNGISKGLFNEDGLCYDWREWWHKHSDE